MALPVVIEQSPPWLLPVPSHGHVFTNACVQDMQQQAAQQQDEGGAPAAAKQSIAKLRREQRVVPALIHSVSVADTHR